MALTCPHCNTLIRGHICQCPECGSWAFKDVKACPDCGTDIDVKGNVATQQQIPVIPPHREQPPRTVYQSKRPCPVGTPQKRSQRKSGNGCLKSVSIVCFIALCLASVAYGAYRYNLDRLARKEAVRQELAKRIAEDEKANAVKLHQAQQDSAFWEKAFKAKTIEAAREYIATYPEGIFINEAYMLIEELQRRSVSPTELAHIKGIIENRLAQIREQFIKNGKRGTKDIQYRLCDSLDIYKKSLNRDSCLYVIRGNVERVTIPAGKAKPDTANIDLRMTLDRHKKIIKSNIENYEKP